MAIRYDAGEVQCNILLYVYVFVLWDAEEAKKMYANARKEHPSGPSALL